MDLLDPLLLARWQFGLTTLYHFLFVPLTLGMALTVAIFQTAWFRTGNLKWLHLTRFFGKIFLINFAMGVVTGIVQEFQFGMNWSSYSRFVGDVFGAPLAFEGLMAFFFEATFIGLWIFGWDKLPKGAAPREHLDRDDRRVVLGVLHPRRERLHAEPRRLPDGRGRLARRDDRLPRGAHQPGRARGPAAHALRGVHDDRGRHHLDLGLAPRAPAERRDDALVAAVRPVGHDHRVRGRRALGRPAEPRHGGDAADEDGRGRGDCSTPRAGRMPRSRSSRSARPTARASCSRSACPYLLALLSTHSLDGCVEGINDLNALYTTELFPQFADQVDGNFAPILWVTYWSFRWMIGLGGVAALTAVVGLWLTRKNAKREEPAWAWRLAIWAWPASLFAILVGWIFTEMGRQPWIVFSLMLTEDGVSPSVPGWTVLISLDRVHPHLRGPRRRRGRAHHEDRRRRAPIPCRARTTPIPRELAVEDTPTTVY